MTTAAPTTAAAFVARLLATDDADKRRALIERADLDSAGFRDAVLALVDEAERVMGADPRRMELACLDALALADRADDDYLRAMARMRHGDYLRIAGRNAEARDRFDEAAAVFKRLGRPVEAARTRIGWAWVTTRLGRPDEALAAARTARRVLIAHGEVLRVAGLDLSIVQIHFDRGHFRRALLMSSVALATFRSLGDAARPPIARMHANRATILTRLGRYTEALREFESARDTYEAMGERIGAARVTRNMGEALMEIGRYTAALRSFEEALTSFRRLDLHNEAAQVAPVLAECYLSLNRPVDAITVLAAAEEDLRGTDDLQAAFGIASRRVAAHLLLGEHERALGLLDQADLRFQTAALGHRAWLAEQRAALVLRDGDPVEALDLARRAYGLAHAAGARRRVAAALLIEGAALLALGDAGQAAGVAERARRLARRVDAPPLLARTHELLGRIAEAKGRVTAARRHYVAAIEQLEREQRGVIFEFRDAFAAERGTAYERLVLLELQAGRSVDAFHTAERAKSRALADAIAGAVEVRPRGSVEARRLARELARARGEYAAAVATRQTAAGSDGDQDGAQRRTTEIEHRIADLIRRLQLAGADADAALYGGAPSAAVPNLPPETALIEYFTSGDDILRFRVDHTGVRAERFRNALPAVERLMHILHLNLETASCTPAGTPAHAGLVAQARTLLTRLWDQLLGGFVDLDAYRSLVIIPHGRLHYLPFHAFHDGTRYLTERVAVSYAPSAALYAVCETRSRRPRLRRTRSLVLAHSDGGRLPAAVDEAAAVGAVLGAPVYAEEQATRTLLEREGRRAGLIHIAAHGVFRPDAPLFSRIELADGALTTTDIFSLNLRAALVTLSACETGRAVIGGGDELAGLARAFLYAGTAGLLVSQWRVDDASTATLMSRFYRALAAGAGHAEALQTAQIEAIGGGMPERDAVHPFFWAGFQVIGGD